MRTCNHYEHLFILSARFMSEENSDPVPEEEIEVLEGVLPPSLPHPLDSEIANEKSDADDEDSEEKRAQDFQSTPEEEEKRSTSDIENPSKIGLDEEKILQSSEPIEIEKAPSNPEIEEKVEQGSFIPKTSEILFLESSEEVPEQDISENKAPQSEEEEEVQPAKAVEQEKEYELDRSIDEFQGDSVKNEEAEAEEGKEDKIKEELLPEVMEEMTQDVGKLDLQPQSLTESKDENSNKSSLTSPTVKTTVSRIPTTPTKTGMRLPTSITRSPAVPLASQTAPNSARTSAPQTPRTPISMQRRHETPTRMGPKTNSTKSIENVGKFTPKVNAKYAKVSSKVASKTNHKAGGGNVEIFSEAKKYEATSKVGSMEKANYVPGGGNVKIENRKLDFSAAKPKVASKTDHKAGGGNVQILSEKLTWNADSKVGSMDNAKHKPTGGNVQILHQKLTWKAESKVGSKDNIKHRPGGGNVKIFDEKIRYVSQDSSANQSQTDISSL